MARQSSPATPASARRNSTGVRQVAQTSPDLRLWRATAKHPFGQTICQGAAAKVSVWQRVAATDLARLAPPDGIMAVARPDQRVGDLVKDGIADMPGLGVPDIVA